MAQRIFSALSMRAERVRAAEFELRNPRLDPFARRRLEEFLAAERAASRRPR